MATLPQEGAAPRTNNCCRSKWVSAESVVNATDMQRAQIFFTT